MAHGLKIRNNGNVVIIDQNYTNLCLRQKVTYTQSTQVPGESNYKLLFTINCTRKGILAFRSISNFTGVVWFTQISDTQKTVTLYSYYPITLDVFVFDDPQFAIKSGSVGLRIKNPTTGEWTFDSRCKYMRILGYITAPTGANLGQEVTYAGGSRLPAAIPIQHYRESILSNFDTGSGTIYEESGINLQTLCSGNNITVKTDEWVYDSNGSSGTGIGWQSGTGLVMMVDVTGY